MSKKIKWGCVEPLTGGMYLGAEEAIGHKAEWVVSFKDFAGFTKDKNGNIVGAANEQDLIEYLKQKDRMPDWFLVDHDPFVDDDNFNPPFIKPEGYDVCDKDAPDYSDMDLVVAVPFCSGLSMSSTADDEHKAMRNCNMIWVANYIIKTIRPKIYLFENAPTLMSTRGDEMRNAFEDLAINEGYSVIYYKTDTKFHHNCQKRPRTFIMFVKDKNNMPYIPELKYEHDTVSVEQFFNEMKAALTQENDPMDVTLTTSPVNVQYPIEYARYVYGPDWRSHIKGDILGFVCFDKDKREKFLEWAKDNVDEKSYKWYERYMSHISEKLNDNKGWWSVIAKYFGDCLPACMYKNVPVTVHHTEDRLYTMREWFWAMGHPTDYNMIGTPVNYFRQMGQNVPVHTAKWMVSECVRILENWDNEMPTVPTDLFEHAPQKRYAFYDNAKMKRIW